MCLLVYVHYLVCYIKRAIIKYFSLPVNGVCGCSSGSLAEWAVDFTNRVATICSLHGLYPELFTGNAVRVNEPEKNSVYYYLIIITTITIYNPLIYG